VSAVSTKGSSAIDPARECWLTSILVSVPVAPVRIYVQEVPLKPHCCDIGHILWSRSHGAFWDINWWDEIEITGGQRWTVQQRRRLRPCSRWFRSLEGHYSLEKWLRTVGEIVGGENYYHSNGNCYHRDGNPLRNITGKLVRLQKFDVFRWTGAILVTRAVISGIIRNKQYMVLAHRIDCWILGESDTEGIVQRFATTSLQKIKMWWMSPQYIYHTYLCLGL